MPFFFHIPPVPPVPGFTRPPMIALKEIYTAAETDQINAMASRIEPEAVRVGGDFKVNRERNRSVSRHLAICQENLWLYQKLADVSAHMNSQIFKFDLSGLDEMLYHVTYFGGDQGHYDWHIDENVSDQPERKLSITVQMTDPSEYDGGELEINRNGDPVVAPKEKGAVISFPSHHLHRVRPVTRGIRCALVAWVVGPPLR